MQCTKLVDDPNKDFKVDIIEYTNGHKELYITQDSGCHISISVQDLWDITEKYKNHICDRAACITQ